MTEDERTAYLNFCCGLLLGCLVSIRHRVPLPEADHVDTCLEMVQPLMTKVYQFQAQQENPPSGDVSTPERGAI